MKVLLYGAGNIGRGFLGQLFYQSGYEIVFVDVNSEVVDLLNRDGRYPVKILGNKHCQEIMIGNARAVNGLDPEAVSDEIAGADIMATAVGVNVLPKIAANIARGIIKRYEAGARPFNIIICENRIDADKYVREAVKRQMPEEYHDYAEKQIGFVEASVGRMVPVMTEEMKEGNPLKVWVEEFCTLPVDESAFRGPIPCVKGLEPSSPFQYHIQSKLFLHNMGHALTAYLGQIKGYRYIWQSIEDPEIRAICRKAMEASALALSREHGKDFTRIKEYAEDLISRFGNRYLGDTVERVGRDIKRKLSPDDRLVGAAKLCRKHGIENTYILYGVAAALMFQSADEGTAEVGRLMEVHGIGEVLREICGLQEEDAEYRNILALYEHLK